MTLETQTSGVSRDPAAVIFRPKIGSRVGAALLASVLVIGIAVLGAAEPREWVAWLLLASQLPMAVIRWLAVRQARRQPWALRVDRSGVWWSPQEPPLPWAALANIEVHQARGLHRLLPHWNRVLLVNHAEADFARRAKSRPVGRSVLLNQVQATPHEIVAALQRFTDAPAGLRLR